MKKIEKEMLKAIYNVKSGKEWCKGNTRVFAIIGGVEVHLHGNRIATVDGEEVKPDLCTLRDYPTNTTKSRLRALGVNVYTKNHVTFIDGKDLYTLLNK